MIVFVCTSICCIMLFLFLRANASGIIGTALKIKIVKPIKRLTININLLY